MMASLTLGNKGEGVKICIKLKRAEKKIKLKCPSG